MSPINIEFRATSKLDSRYVRFLGKIEKSNCLGCDKYIGVIGESSLLFTYFDVVVDDRHSCIISVTQEQIQELEDILKKELSSYDQSMFHNSPNNPKLYFNNSLCKYGYNYRFLEYNCRYWECMRLLYRCIKDINEGVSFDWNKDTLEIIFSW